MTLCAHLSTRNGAMKRLRENVLRVKMTLQQVRGPNLLLKTNSSILILRTVCPNFFSKVQKETNSMLDSCNGIESVMPGISRW